MLRILFLCSTPVGVIGIFTRARRCGAHSGFSVLNACRRHRNLHRLNIFGNPFGVGVLNACRRHRNLHVSVVSTSDSQYWCSTPVGVIGIFTRVRRLPRAGQLVLNACRRHRNLHMSLLDDLLIFYRCSTPVGVIGIFTTATGNFYRRNVLCSTPVGVIGIFTLPPLPFSALSESAQRLSAS